MRWLLVMLVFAACSSEPVPDTPGSADPSVPDRAHIGKCAVNSTNGIVVGTIIGVEVNPAFGELAYRVQDREDPARKLYLNNVAVAECADVLEPADLREDADRVAKHRADSTATRAAQAGEEAVRSDDLIGKCGYNRSDGKLIGRIVAVGQRGRDGGNRPAEGQRALTINHAELGPTKFTYPRNMTVSGCP